MSKDKIRERIRELAAQRHKLIEQYAKGMREVKFLRKLKPIDDELRQLWQKLNGVDFE